jgi:3-phosphoshikimate 1-carboxyvinyltransferase
MSSATRLIEPVRGPIDAVVAVPGSKSLTNRALVCAALARGQSTIRGALVADDRDAMVECLRGLGASISVSDDAGSTVLVDGLAGSVGGGGDLDARLSGTTARFVLPLLALGGAPTYLDGRPPLRARPMGPLIDGLRSLGAEVVEHGEPGHLPLSVRGPVAGGSVAVSADTTSQFLSALLLAGPAMAQGLEVEATTAMVSAPYVAMTTAVMRAFGADVDGLRVAPGGYTAASYAVEADASAASYLFAAAAVCGGRVIVPGLGRHSLQGDVGFVDVLAAMGASVSRDEDAIAVTGTGALRGVDVDLRDMPDMAQTLAAVAVFADGPTTVRGVGFIRGHETDRIAAVVRELGRCGLTAATTADGFVVQPGIPRPARVETYDDHRMAMSFALLGLRVPGIEIADPEVVAKTFPGYWDALGQLGSASR